MYLFVIKEVANNYATDTNIQKIFNDGKTIIVRNKLDSLGRLSENKIIVNDADYTTKYNYDKTRVLVKNYIMEILFPIVMML